MLKPKNAHHSAFNSVIKKDWIAAIYLSPDNFDGLLYLPENPTSKDESGNYEDESVIELDTHQDMFKFQEPISVKCLECPDESEFFYAMNDAGDALGESDEPLLLRIGYEKIAVGSVIEFNEKLMTDSDVEEDRIRTVWWYVKKNMAYGTQIVGTVSVCVPMRDFSPYIGAELPEPEEEPELELSEEENEEIQELVQHGTVVEL